MCRKTCVTYRDSVRTAFADPKLCSQSPTVGAKQARDSYIQALSCNELLENDCDVGIMEDVQKCGFASSNDATAYCQKSKSDPCCFSISAAVTTNINIPLIIGASCGGLLLICIIGYFVFRKRKDRTSKSSYDSGFKPPKFANAFKRLSPFSPNPLFGGRNDDGLKSDNPAQFPPALAYTDNRTRMQNNQGFNDHRKTVYSTIAVNQGYNEPRLNAPQKNPRMTQEFRGGGESVFPNYNKTNKRIKATDFFHPNIDDEIQIEIGDILLVHEEYDDGWAFGVNLCSRCQGVFPLAVGEVLQQGGASKPAVHQPQLQLNGGQKSQATLLNLNDGKQTSNSSKFKRKTSLQKKAANNNKVRCLEQYTPSLEDEIYIRFDDVLIIFEKFDDGTDV